MPTYDYKCTKCGYTFEAFHGMNDKAVEKCPKCGKKVKRLISSGAGIIFKGSGFYATDYRKGSGKHPPKNTCPKAKEGCDGCKNA